MDRKVWLPWRQNVRDCDITSSLPLPRCSSLSSLFDKAILQLWITRRWNQAGDLRPEQIVEYHLLDCAVDMFKLNAWIPAPHFSTEIPALPQLMAQNMYCDH